MARKTRTTTPASTPKATFTLTAVSVRPTFTHKADHYEGAPRAVRLYREAPVVFGGGKLWPIAGAQGDRVTLANAPVCDMPAASVNDHAPAAKMADLARLGFAKAKAEPAKPEAASPAPVAPAPAGDRVDALAKQVEMLAGAVTALMAKLA
jgi:hypothetical protein